MDTFEAPWADLVEAKLADALRVFGFNTANQTERTLHLCGVGTSLLISAIPAKTAHEMAKWMEYKVAVGKTVHVVVWW